MRGRHNPHEAASGLVLRAKMGDRAAFCELVRRYRPRIYALALHLTGSESDADDVAQEAFLNAYRALSRFDGRSEFFTWVYRIAVNRSLSARRDQARRGAEPIDDPRVERALAVDARGDPARAAELRITYRRLIAALDRLSPAMKTTVVLVALQGLSYGEAAVIQGCPAGTVAWRMHEAREHLRRALAEPPVPPLRPAERPRQVSSELAIVLEEWGLPAPAEA